MVTLERIDAGFAPISRRAPGPAASPTEETTIAQRIRTGGTSLFWPMRLLPPPRRDAMQALYLFCRELRDVADGNGSRTLKLVLLADWRTQIALLYAGRPQHVVTRALRDAIKRFGLCTARISSPLSTA